MLPLPSTQEIIHHSLSNTRPLGTSTRNASKTPVSDYGSNPGTRLGMICLHVPVKGSRESRNSSSSFAFFDGGGKQPIVYNLRH